MGGLKFRLAAALAPRELAFFSLLEAAGSNAADATARLEELAHFFPERHDLLDELRRHARESDRITRELNDRLSATYVTPIEREDVYAVASAIDDLVRTSHAVAVLFDVYLVGRVRPAARRLTQLLARSAQEAAEALALVRDARDVEPHTTAIRTLVEEGDETARAGLAELFAENPAPIELVRWNNRYDRLQGALATVRRSASMLDAVARKQR